VFSGTSPDGTLVEYVELDRAEHPFYIGTQAHPELRSRPNRAHPLFSGLVGASLERQNSSRLFADDADATEAVVDAATPTATTTAGQA
jgi:CTP synthase